MSDPFTCGGGSQELLARAHNQHHSEANDIMRVPIVRLPFLVLCLGFVATPSSIRAQSGQSAEAERGPCLSTESKRSQMLVSGMRRVMSTRMTGGDQLRERLGISYSADPSDVIAITDPDLCRRALHTVRTGLDRTIAADSTIVLVQIGNRYVAMLAWTHTAGMPQYLGRFILDSLLEKIEARL